MKPSPETDELGVWTDPERTREMVHGGSFALGMVVGFCLAVLLWGGGLWAGGFYG
jgi:hypothetical protein